MKAASSNMLVYWAGRPGVKVLSANDFAQDDRRGARVSTTPFMTTESPTSFEAALAELEALVATMESGQLPLKESLAAYQRGAALLAYCQESLRDAQQQVDVLEKGVLKSFRPDTEDDA
jgi:exodeoxyribonuclease VII small subunit